MSSNSHIESRGKYQRQRSSSYQFTSDLVNTINSEDGVDPNVNDRHSFFITSRSQLPLHLPNETISQTPNLPTMTAMISREASPLIWRHWLVLFLACFLTFGPYYW